MFSIRNQKNERKKMKLDLISKTKRVDSISNQKDRNKRFRFDSNRKNNSITLTLEARHRVTALTRSHHRRPSNDTARKRQLGPPLTGIQSHPRSRGSGHRRPVRLTEACSAEGEHARRQGDRRGCLHLHPWTPWAALTFLRRVPKGRAPLGAP